MMPIVCSAERAPLAKSNCKFLSLTPALRLTDDDNEHDVAADADASWDVDSDVGVAEKVKSVEERRGKKWTYSVNKQVDFILDVVAGPVWAVAVP